MSLYRLITKRFHLIRRCGEKDTLASKANDGRIDGMEGHYIKFLHFHVTFFPLLFTDGAAKTSFR